MIIAALALTMGAVADQRDPLPYARAAWRECLAAQPLAAALPGQTDAQIVDAALARCRADQGAVYAFLMLTYGETAGTRRMERELRQLRQRMIEALRRSREAGPAR